MDKTPEKKEYSPKEIENKWSKVWDESKIYKTPKVSEIDKSKKKIHVMDMFPYPSGEGLHTGHAKVFGASDIYARFKRMQGFNVLHATGFDSFGLPAEQFAIKNKVNPKVSSLKNENTYLAQMKLMGFSYDYDRLIKTTDPEFYKWTQWAFKEMYKAGLCYESFEPINWCPSCLTGLANEDLDNGVCERCGSVVEKKPIRQWVIRITDYAEKLLQGIDANSAPRPLYIDNVQPPKQGLKTTNRKGVLFLVKHWSEDKYLLNISEKYNWKILFTGGIEEGENPFETVRREVIEETGYKNIKNIRKINFEHTDNFERVHKGDNALVEQTNMFVELADGEQQERSEEEAALHKLEWHTREEMSKIIDRRNHKFIFDYAVNGDTSDFEKVFVGYKKEDYFKDYSGLDWRENIKEMQRNWIGKNEGVKYKLKIKDTDIEIETYSTHFEAFYADTFAVIASDHKMLPKIVKGLPNASEILEEAAKIFDKKNKAGFRELEDHVGVFTGRYLLDPITNTELPLWVSSYALSDYGTGIIKCSAHDSRDFAFAKKYNLPLRAVMFPNDEVEKEKISNFEYCYNDFDNAILELPTEFKGKNPKRAHNDILNYLVKNSYAEKSTQYKLRDWVFARQRYWGEPFPIVFDENHKSYVVADKCLPVVLPDVESYEPTGDGESPLKNIKDFYEVYGFINSDGEFEELDKGDKNAKLFFRETNTMPQWAGSSWYWLRYMDPHNSERLVSIEEENYWGQVDVYIGGMEHATRHLIYGRFWNQFLFDKGYISVSEPFKRLEAVGLVLGAGGVKMSKRLGNVVNPDDVIKQFGADTLRLYIAFAGDFHDSFSWDEKSIVGPRRFIERVWNLQNKTSDEKNSSDVEIIMHQTIKKVTSDIEALKFNTAVAQMMIFVNAVEKEGKINRDNYLTLLKLLAPICPFVCEELWSILGEKKSIHLSSWPTFDKSKIRDLTVNIAVQIGGKLRDVFLADIDSTDESIIAMAKATDGYKKWVGETEPKKIIVVKNKVVNIVL